MLLLLTCITILLFITVLFPQKTLARLYLNKIHKIFSPYTLILAIATALLSFYCFVQVCAFLLQNTEQFVKAFVALMGIALAMLMSGKRLSKASSTFLQKAGENIEGLRTFLTHPERAYFFLVAFTVTIMAVIFSVVLSVF